MDSKILLLYLSRSPFPPDAARLKCNIREWREGSCKYHSQFIQKAFTKECSCVFGSEDSSYLVLAVNSGSVYESQLKGSPRMTKVNI